MQATTAVVRWYLGLYFRTPDDPGVAPMFCDPSRVGHFALDPHLLAAGEPRTLFRLWFVITMFQRRQDVQIMRILRGFSAEDAAEVSSATRLLQLVDDSPCDHMKQNDALITRCDLTKDARTRLGRCSANPKVPCHLKRHTVLLKRYGHFGKVPTSLALVLRETGARHLKELRERILRDVPTERERALALEAALCAAWRVSQKIAAMFLSAISNPELSDGIAPWADGVDWSYFVVIDSNVDLFLSAINYSGPGTYEARRSFVQALAEKIDLSRLDTRLSAYNPRVVQQALYLFMSSANRGATERDCSHLGAVACAACPKSLSRMCPSRRT